MKWDLGKLYRLFYFNVEDQTGWVYCSTLQHQRYYRLEACSTSSPTMLSPYDVVPYDVVPKLQKILMTSNFKVLIADESHFLKNAQAKRTNASLPVIQGVFGSYRGASNHEELHNLMKATVMIRRLKKDVLSELPVKRKQVVLAPGDIIQAEDRAHRIGQMLDGPENALEVSDSKPRSSPAKQRTLDSFISK